MLAVSCSTEGVGFAAHACRIRTIEVAELIGPSALAHCPRSRHMPSRSLPMRCTAFAASGLSVKTPKKLTFCELRQLLRPP